MPDRSQTVHRALIVAPRGRDGAILLSLLHDVGVSAQSLPDLASCESHLDDDVCFCVITEEALLQSPHRGPLRWLAAQPSWSDLPFIVLAHSQGSAHRIDIASHICTLLGNVTFVERPFHPTTFVSVARTAVKTRLRQYEARARIEELKEGEQRLRTALSAGQLGSWELDLERWTLTASDVCKAMFGRSPPSLFRYPDLLASVHAEDRPAMRAAVRKSVETGAEYSTEHRVVWPDGSIHWVEMRARRVPTTTATGQSYRLVGVSRDITSSKTAQQTLKLLNSSLEARVAERTAALEQAHQKILEEIAQRERTEELLRQSQKMEMLGQLTGGIAHDFNNLLMAVLGNLELLRKQVPANARVTRLIDGAIHGTNRGAALTQRLLAFARRQDLTIGPVDVGKLLGGMHALIERSAGPGIELVTALSPDMPMALIDANQLELAILNLVVNARDAMPRGGMLTIRSTVVDAPAAADLAAGRYICLSVTDNGAGMDAATLARATEPFFSTKEIGKGTGLGLSMVHGLARQLKGTLRLRSEPGRGTSAELWLPVTDKAESVATVAEAAADTQGVKGLTILVVDDDPLVCASTAALLEDLGHIVIEAETGAQAIDILRAGNPVDLLITDYSMPGMTGVELVRAARELSPGLPAFLATGYAEALADTAPELPKLRKPYRQSQVSAQIAELFGSRLQAVPSTNGKRRSIILVVEDDRIVRESTAAMLEDLGFDTIEMESGEDALDLLRTGRTVDLIIADYSMGGMTGTELARSARTIHSDLPVLITTGYGEIPVHNDDAQLPMLRKPYGPSQVMGEIEKILGSRRPLA
jgi:PAS domain S-box-containing protein